MINDYKLSNNVPTWWDDLQVSSVVEVNFHGSIRALRQGYHAFKVVVDGYVSCAIDFK